MIYELLVDITKSPIIKQFHEFQPSFGMLPYINQIIFSTCNDYF